MKASQRDFDNLLEGHSQNVKNRRGAILATRRACDFGLAAVDLAIVACDPGDDLGSGKT
jgi:hypothetical protein